MSDETEDETPENTPDNNNEGNNPEQGTPADGQQAAAEENQGGDPDSGNVKFDELDENGEKKELDETIHKTAHDLEAVFDVPVSISAVLGRTHMEVSELLHLESGDVIELDRKVGEAIDIYVNNRLIARGEVVLLEEKLGITMTEIIKTERH